MILALGVSAVSTGTRAEGTGGETVAKAAATKAPAVQCALELTKIVASTNAVLLKIGSSMMSMSFLSST
jgi:hypothetical protein